LEGRGKVQFCKRHVVFSKINVMPRTTSGAQGDNVTAGQARLRRLAPREIRMENGLRVWRKALPESTGLTLLPCPRLAVTGSTLLPSSLTGNCRRTGEKPPSGGASRRRRGRDD
jgi:hypothetical protein